MSPEVVRLDEQKLARAALTYLAEPADPALGALLEICEPAEVLAAIKADMLPRTGGLARRPWPGPRSPTWPSPPTPRSAPC